MIARTWHGIVPADKSDAYFAYLQRTGIPDYRATPGNRGVYVLRAIRAFAVAGHVPHWSHPARYASGVAEFILEQRRPPTRA